MHGYHSPTTPHRGSESEDSDCVQALRFIAPASQELAYGDTFEDTPSECQFFAHEPTELEDSGDDDWVPKSERTRSNRAVSARSAKSRATVTTFRRTLASKTHADGAVTSDSSQLGVLSTSPQSEEAFPQHPQFSSRDSEKQTIPSRIPPSSLTEASNPHMATRQSEDPHPIFDLPGPVWCIPNQALIRSKMSQATNKMAARGRPEYRQAILGSSKPRTSFAQNAEETISVPPRSEKRNQHDTSPAGGSVAKHVYASDSDSDVEVSTIRPRKGRSAEDPVEVGSGDETQKIPANNGHKLKRRAVSRQKSTKIENETPIAYAEPGRSGQVTVDLTMLLTSDSSGSSSDESSTDDTSDNESESDGIIGIGESDHRGPQLEPVNNQHARPKLITTRDGNHTDDSSNSDDEAQAHDAWQATTSAQTTPCSPPDSGDEAQETAVDEWDMEADDGDLKIPELEMFYSHEAPLPLTLKREEELARARDESARLEHEAANHQRWLNGEPYVPFPEPATKRELNGAVENEAMIRARQRKLNQLAREAIRTSTRDGISPHFIRRRDHESDISFAARLLKFKVEGWKKRVDATRPRRRLRRARIMRAALASASKQEDQELRNELLERQAFDEMMAPN